MTYSTVPRVHRYFRAVELVGAYESVAEFFLPNATFQEFPNRIAPYGRVRHAAVARAAYDAGRKLCSRKLMASGASLKRVMNWPLNWRGLESWLSL
jgi:hypothetical protein